MPMTTAKTSMLKHLPCGLDSLEWGLKASLRFSSINDAKYCSKFLLDALDTPPARVMTRS